MRNSDKEITSAVACSIGSHSSTTEVCVAFRHRRTGGAGSDSPNEEKIESWRAVKAAWDFCSEAKLRETVMSTMLPEEILGGRRIEGNSICWELSVQSRNQCQAPFVAPRGSYTSLLSWVSSTATPASTLPTVNEINMVDFRSGVVPGGERDTLRQSGFAHC